MTNMVSLSNLEEIHESNRNQNLQFVDNDITVSTIFDFADSLYDSASSENNCVSNYTTESDWNSALWSLNENTYENSAVSQQWKHSFDIDQQTPSYCEVYFD